MKIFESYIESGQQNLIDTIKKSLYLIDNEIFDTLDFYKDELYQEPLLYAFMSGDKSQFPLKQILFKNYFENEQPIEFELKTDADGTIYLPDYGYLNTELPSQYLKARKASGGIELSKNEESITFSKNGIRYSQVHPQIEFTNYIDLLSRRFFVNWANFSAEQAAALLSENSQRVGDEHYEKLDRALNLIEQISPWDHKMIGKLLKRIVLFNEPELRCFATVQAHGCIYINADKDATVPYFAEEIIHQYSHVVFNAVLQNPSQFFKMDQNTKFSEITGDDDNRTLFGTFHGMYTTSKIVEFFLTSLERADLGEILTELEIKEITGRLALNKKRLNPKISQTTLMQLFTPLGTELYNHLDDFLRDNMRANQDRFNYNLDGTKWVFNFEAFLRDNAV